VLTDAHAVGCRNAASRQSGRRCLPEGVVLVVVQIVVLEAGGSVGGMGINIIFARLFYNPGRRLIIFEARPYVAAERGLLFFLKPGIATNC
jgi:hypothetical protein